LGNCLMLAAKTACLGLASETLCAGFGMSLHSLSIARWRAGLYSAPGVARWLEARTAVRTATRIRNRIRARVNPKETASDALWEQRAGRPRFREA
jgi:hypothetical protein